MHTLRFLIDDPSVVGEARRSVAQLAQKLGFSDVAQGNAAIIVNELGHNLAKYARGGSLLVRVLSEAPGGGIEILSVDSGPGLESEKALRDGYSTGGTPGTGLGAVARTAQQFDLFSQMGKGTVIVARVFEQKPPSPGYEVGAVSIPLKGESVCGDGWAVLSTAEGARILVADGLGHGPLASQAAHRACAVFVEQSKLSLEPLMMSLHNALKPTRGAAIFLASLEKEKVNFAGVGNIRCVLFAPMRTKSLISQNGTAGLQIRQPKALSEPWTRDGFAVFHSDGLVTKASLADYPGIFSRHPSLVAAVLWRDFSRGSDDATVLAVRMSK